MARVSRRARGRKAQGREQRNKLHDGKRWWNRPEMIVLLLACGLALAGWALVLQARRTIPVRQATLYGLEARLNQARWLVDQMEHGEGFARPAAMMPGMPEQGSQRLSVELSIRNVLKKAVFYRGQEFTLLSNQGNEYPPISAQMGKFKLDSGLSLNTSIYFDFDSSRDLGKLRLRWTRGDKTIYMPIPHPPEHYHARPRDTVWPDDVLMLMPIAEAERGEALFSANYGCSACHGDLSEPGSNNVGPHLGRIGAEASSRVPGMRAEQYIYESILRPDAFLAPECKNGPCPTPSAMPDYSGLLTEQEMGDLVIYLLEQTGEPH